MQDAMNPLSVRATFEALKSAGFPRPYVEKLLPDWWDNNLFKTSAGALQFAVLVRQRLGLDVRFEPDGEMVISRIGPAARFKHRVNTKESELQVAASLGTALARLALFSVSAPYKPLPDNPKVLAALVLAVSGKRHVDFEGLLETCWQHGVPVLFLKNLPRATKRVTGMAVRCEGRPVVILGYNSRQEARQLFVLAHELGHISLGHLADSGVLIDEDIAEVNEAMEGAATSRKDAEEQGADRFALSLLRNGNPSPLEQLGHITSSAQLASAAVKTGGLLGIDPGHLILSYAKEKDDWLKANQAIGYLPTAATALSLIESKFKQHASLDELTGENREHLLQVQGF